MDQEGIRTGALLFGAGASLGLFLYFFVLKPRLERRSAALTSEKQQFFTSIASHYLLTPVSIIQAAHSRLVEEDGSLNPDERRKLYGAIESGQQRLWIIAVQLVLVSGIAEGKMPVNPTVANAAEVAAEAMRKIAVFARGKRMGLKLRDLGGGDREFRFDRRRILQALIAILDNAVKFSPESSTVTAELREDGGWLEIMISDEGIGISDDVRANLFKKFHRGSSLYDFDYEGLGLGLHIAEAIVKAHGGSLAVEPRRPAGTAVTVRLPLQ